MHNVMLSWIVVASAAGGGGTPPVQQHCGKRAYDTRTVQYEYRPALIELIPDLKDNTSVGSSKRFLTQSLRLSLA